MRHAAALRVSLLVSMGIVPVACGGTVRHGGDDVDGGNGDAGRGGTAQGTGGGATSVAGKPSRAGAASTTGGSTPIGGTTSTSTGGGPPIFMGGAGGSPSCTSPQLDPVTGLVTCAEGYEHRPRAERCELAGELVGGAPSYDAGGASGGDGAGSAPPPRADGSVPCSDNPDKCLAYELGYCAFGQFPVCLSGCQADADCGPGALCRCGLGPRDAGVCVAAACTTDADCGPSSLCASYADGGGCGSSGFACLQPSDECTTTADCAGELGAYCSYDSSAGRRRCNSAVCGRPFLVESEARVAPAVRGEAWRAPGSALPSVDHLTDAERKLLAEHWTRLGQLEHASIAAFARFSLQLLALGAPPALVEACTRALSDETAHTRLCFHLASAYAGHAIGPGRLDVGGSLEQTSLVEVVELVIAEGCFGETGAALEALEAADAATDPVIVAAYRQIAADEQRHAELAFQFVRWALQRSETAVSACISRLIAQPPQRDAAAFEVAVPCLQRLLAA
jgi:hypothetical protein